MAPVSQRFLLYQSISRSTLFVVALVIFLVVTPTAASATPYLQCPNVSRVAAARPGELLFLEPLLHACFDEHPYDTRHLPFAPGQPHTRLRLEFDFMLNSLIELQNDGTILLESALHFTWQDLNRRWNASEIPLRGISLPAHELWHPRFVLVNAHDRHMFVRPHVGRESVYVSNEGHVSLNIVKMIVAECNMRLERFPFDKQECHLVFVLADYTSEDVELHEMEVHESLVDFENEDWDYLPDLYVDHPINMTLKASERKFSKNKSERQPISLIGFEVVIVFQRHNNNANLIFEVLHSTVGDTDFDAQKYFLFNLIIPVVVMALIGVFSVVIPIGSGDKINLVIMVFLGFLFFQSAIAAMMPKSNQPPLLMQYVLGALVLTAINLACTIIVQAIFRAGRKADKQLKRGLMKAAGRANATDDGMADGEMASRPFLLRPSKIAAFMRKQTTSKKGRQVSKQIKAQMANETPMPPICETSIPTTDKDANKTINLTDVTSYAPNNEPLKTNSTPLLVEPSETSSVQLSTSKKRSTSPGGKFETLGLVGGKKGKVGKEKVLGNFRYPLVYCLKLAWILNIAQSIIYIGGHIMISYYYLFPILSEDE